MTTLACSPSTTANRSPASDANMLRDHAYEHAKYMIGNTPVLTYPFPHQHVSTVFPDYYYTQLHQNFPSSECFKPLSASYPKRGTIELHTPGSLDHLPEQQRSFWSWFVQQFGSKDFMAFVLDRYAPLLGHRFRHNVKPQMYLFRDTGGYGIGPHTDTFKKVVTMLFYLPKDDSQRHAGTSIVVPKDPNYEFQPTGHETWNNFRAAKTVEFLPNSLVSFVVTDRSLHAVRPTPPDTVRQSLQYFICQD